MNFPQFITFLFLSVSILSCDDDAIIDTQDYSATLQNLGNNVILATYQDLADKADLLQVATLELEKNKTATNLENAKQAWIAARSPWEQSEGFLFGPVDQEGLDPALDSWPVNVIDLQNVLSGSSDLTVTFLNQQEGTLKGFHTLEYLLWGETGHKNVGDITSREFEYIAAAAGALAQDSKKLFDTWSTTGGGYISNVINAGKSSVVYKSQKSALEEMVDGLIVIADEVANGKIHDPFSQQDLTLEESRFSANSKADFSNNMRSIRNIYLGNYINGTDEGLYDIIRSKDEAAANNIKVLIADAIIAIESIDGTFSSAVFDAKNDVENAQKAVRDLQLALEEKALPIISNL